MCRRTTCRKCGKPSWAGCGAHVEMVLGDVPKSERCRCHEQPAGRASATARSKAGAAVPSGAVPSSDDSAVSRFKAWLKK